MINSTADNVGDEDPGARAKSEKPKPEDSSKPLPLIALAALGIVFGDIGTSPLYTMKTVLSGAGETVDRAATLGVLSLLVWTLIIVTSIKYVSVAMRVDNDGEGGILALMSLIGIKRGHRPAIIAVGLFGAALIYGDGAITPAISVLSALEGLHLAIPSFDPYVLPAAIAILVALFALQSRGTSSIGKLFGPVMATWFVVIAVMGLHGIAQNPSVLVGLSPTYAIAYLTHGGFTAFALLGSVFLCVTGAEALYADMGHFGKRPIWLAWFAAVFPALIINYAGQAAIVLNGAPTHDDNIFFRLCPPVLLVPLILLATLATIIASQSIITGAFSMTRQAIQLGWMPRLVIKQTSEEGYGQIYVSVVNWLLMIVTVGLTLAFRKSDNLASAYGIAVSATMLMTSGLLYIAMREVWGWSIVTAGLVATLFVVVDGAFFASNLLKLADGGWVPLVLATAVYAIMRIWHTGVAAIATVLRATRQPLGTFFEKLETDGIARVKGTAVFLTRAQTDTPPLLVWHVRQNRCLYEDVLIVTIVTALVPRISGERFAVTRERAGVWRVLIRNGFMERLSLGAMLPAMQAAGCDIDLDKVVFYVGHETIVRGQRGKRLLGGVTERVFAAMERNQAHLTDVLGLPSERVVEIGRHIEL